MFFSSSLLTHKIHVAFHSGNALTTVKSKDEIKVFTIRGTAFQAAEETGGGATTDPGIVLAYQHTLLLASFLTTYYTQQCFNTH